ncbi:MAG: sigma-70 family RNA polymerase sigma factor [Acidobacteriaceae bacterium]|nr:sigma-70 family RNA polymerase sigma factor [Acidobacteriaceae bacterium]
MSSAARPKYLDPPQTEDQGFFWIHPVDKEGFEVDPSFIEAAHQKARDLRAYRADELLDDAIRAELVEAAVYAASRARKENPVRDPKRYLFATFARLVDERISKDRLVRHQAPEELEQLPLASSCAPESIERRILCDEILHAMDPEDRWAWQRRVLGYEIREIAIELNITADCLSTRMRRALRQAALMLRLRSEGQ